MLRISVLAVIIALIVLIAASVSIAYYSSPNSKNPSEQQSATEQKSEEQKGESGEDAPTLWQFLFPDSISVFTFWLVFATVALAVVAILQIGFLGRAEAISAQSAKAAQASANAAEKAAIAAKESVDLAKDTATKQLRSYITIHTVDIVPNGEGNRFNIRLQIMNSGQTPAYDLVAWLNVGLWSLPMMGNTFPPNSSIDAVPSRALLGPGGLADIQAELPLKPQEVVEISANDPMQATVGWGELTYLDIFKDKHTLRFKGVAVRKSDKWFWQPTPDNNQGD